MVYLEQNKLNNIVFRFFDRRKRSDSHFLFEIEGQGVHFYYISDDTSVNTCEYNLFTFELDDVDGVQVNNIGASLKLKGGHYTYRVYEKENRNFNLDDVIQIIEEDILFVQLDRSVNTPIQKDIYY